ncbi:MAG: hypothetical protein PW735_04955 [Acidobacteriaceae bacterium]|nr:hypothetical protein [Acidobacteriaceae bacterium]
MRSAHWMLALALAGGVASSSVEAPCLYAQVPAATPHATGTVKTLTGSGLLLTSFVLGASSGEITVNVPAEAKVLLVAPGSKDLKSASVGAVSDIAVGDRVLVSGSAGDAATTLNATRVIVMKSTAIEQTHATEDAAWAKGLGGIVKTVDAATNTIVLASGGKTVVVTLTPTTVIRHYASGSVKFEDATVCKLSDIQPGDQLRVRGTKSEDGSAIAADGMVAGTFENYSGLLTAVDVAAGTVTLKDLALKKTLKVQVTSVSDLRRLPPSMAQVIAARLKGGAAGAASHDAGKVPAGVAPGGPGEAEQRTHRESSGLSSMMSHLPTETLAGLKNGEAVMIVASSSTGNSEPVAVTLLVGVEPILTAPAGETMRLSPWSLGGGGGGDESGGGGR